MKDKPKLDLENLYVKLVITGLVGMIKDEGLSPHEAFGMLEEIKNQTFFALSEIKRDKENVR